MTYQDSLNQLIESLNDFLNRKPLPIIKRTFQKDTKGHGGERFYEMICNGCGKVMESNRCQKLYCDEGNCTERASRSRKKVQKLLEKAAKVMENTKPFQNGDK